MAKKQFNLAAIRSYRQIWIWIWNPNLLIFYGWLNGAFVFACRRMRCWFGAIYSSVAAAAAAKQAATIGRELWIFKLRRKNMIGVSFSTEQAKQMSENEVACRVGRQITISKEHLKLTASHFSRTTWDSRDLLFFVSAFVSFFFNRLHIL